MKGYFTRLIGQTGINIGTGPPVTGTKGRETPRAIHLEEIRPVEPQTNEPPEKTPGSPEEESRSPGGWEENSEYLNKEGVERKIPEKRGKDQGDGQGKQSDRIGEKDVFHREDSGWGRTGQEASRGIVSETIRVEEHSIVPPEGRLHAGDVPAPLESFRGRNETGHKRTLKRTLEENGETIAPDQRFDKAPVAAPPAETKAPVAGKQAWSSTFKEVREWVAGGEKPGKKTLLQGREVEENTWDEKSPGFQGAVQSREGPDASGGSPRDSRPGPRDAGQGSPDSGQGTEAFRQISRSPRQKPEPGMTDYHLSIGTISLIVEGPKEESIQRKPGGEAVKASPGSEGTGSRLSRHYIRI